VNRTGSSRSFLCMFIYPFLCGKKNERGSRLEILPQPAVRRVVMRRVSGRVGGGERVVSSYFLLLFLSYKWYEELPYKLLQLFFN
jgi:hypothetical protein